MLRLEEGAALTLTSRLARPRVLAVLAGALLGGAAAARGVPPLATGLALSALLVVLLGGRSVQAWIGAGRVTVRAALPFARPASVPLATFTGVAVETIAEARRRRAEALADGYAARAGAQPPRWLIRTPTPGANDHLRRVVLLRALGGEPLAVTAWLAPEDDLDPVCQALRARLG